MACRSDGSGREFFQDEALFSPGKVASFRMQVSRTTRKVRPGSSQRACAALALDKCHRFVLSHRLAAVLAMGPREPAEGRTCRLPAFLHSRDVRSHPFGYADVMYATAVVGGKGTPLILPMPHQSAARPSQWWVPRSLPPAC
jgi:hypothetical protein